ncbi:LysR family transcriptional regulator [Limimaricola cinnabarinus]|uniref:LysR family transcriptional regulator n=1 Tax=Limimaricola cinnabarinus TaxID=1125964 RepID=UPI0024907621|nr:LysR family transcriptional regulator [Limimaricola cinnabarinus]
MQDWEGVGEFAAVARTLSFTQAAARLGISTAQVSRRVSALEARLGVKLLHRTTRSVSLTEQGEIYHAHIRPVLDGLAEAERAVTRINAAPAGRLSLTAPVTFGESAIGPLVNDFLTRHPALELTLTLTNQKIDLVAEGYDLAIRLGTLEDSSLIATRLAARTLHVCASPAYLASRGTPQQPGDLSHHNCLQGTLDHWRFRQNGRLRQLRVHGSLRCNSGWSLLDAAIKGVGLVQLPDYYLRTALAEETLAPVLEEFQPPEEGVWAVYPPNRHLSSKVRLLLDFLAERLGRSG